MLSLPLRLMPSIASTCGSSNEAVYECMSEACNTSCSCGSRIGVEVEQRPPYAAQPRTLPPPVPPEHLSPPTQPFTQNTSAHLGVAHQRCLAAAQLAQHGGGRGQRLSLVNRGVACGGARGETGRRSGWAGGQGPTQWILTADQRRVLRADASHECRQPLVLFCALCILAKGWHLHPCCTRRSRT